MIDLQTKILTQEGDSNRIASHTFVTINTNDQCEILEKIKRFFDPEIVKKMREWYIEEYER